MTMERSINFVFGSKRTCDIRYKTAESTSSGEFGIKILNVAFDKDMPQKIMDAIPSNGMYSKEKFGKIIRTLKSLVAKPSKMEKKLAGLTAIEVVLTTPEQYVVRSISNVIKPPRAALRTLPTYHPYSDGLKVAYIHKDVIYCYTIGIGTVLDKIEFETIIVPNMIKAGKKYQDFCKWKNMNCFSYEEMPTNPKATIIPKKEIEVFRKNGKKLGQKKPNNPKKVEPTNIFTFYI